MRLVDLRRRTIDEHQLRGATFGSGMEGEDERFPCPHEPGCGSPLMERRPSPSIDALSRRFGTNFDAWICGDGSVMPINRTGGAERLWSKDQAPSRLKRQRSVGRPMRPKLVGVASRPRCGAGGGSVSTAVRRSRLFKPHYPRAYSGESNRGISRTPLLRLDFFTVACAARAG
jgi:hypothetical protein